MSKAYVPEFIPPQSFNPVDVSNFDNEFTSERPADSICYRGTDLINSKAHFDGFSFFGGKAPSNLDEEDDDVTGGGDP